MSDRKPELAEENDKLTSITIVNNEKCRPKKCQRECKQSCPVVNMGKLCIEVTPADKTAFISEDLCIGCGACEKKCPFEAISIINLPSNLAKETVYRHSPNGFQLHRLPCPRLGKVLGLVGTNGIGKSSALKLLAGKLKPNLARFDDPPDWTEILTHFHGSDLHNFFNKIKDKDLKAIIKPQYVERILMAVEGTVQQSIDKMENKGVQTEVSNILDLEHLRERHVECLSGGELQRFVCGLVCMQRADVYMFDEPSNYLDVKQRFKVAKAIRSLLATEKYIIVVEHDLAVLDYLSDFICCLYGVPGAYGVVSMPFGVREGLNIYLDGFIPSENLRFRETSLTSAEIAKDGASESTFTCEYPQMVKNLGSFSLTVEAGQLTDSEIVVMLGENGTGKTTFIRMLAGKLQPDSGGECPVLNVSYKPQKICPTWEGTVHQLLQDRIRDAYMDTTFVADVIKPLLIADIMDQEVRNLSGGELQRVALILCLGKLADVYLIDEPSVYLDSDQRIRAGKVIKRYIQQAKKAAIVVDHDFMMATYLADRVVVFEGSPGINAKARSPQTFLYGMNKFLELLQITDRCVPNDYRPCINKLNSLKDSEQKASGSYFFLED